MLSVRMRASLEGRHVSGAERIVGEEDIPQTLKELLRRPKVYDRMVITMEKLEKVEIITHSLPIRSFSFRSVEDARKFALELLESAGVDKDVASTAISLLSRGANPEGGNMRGAVLMDIRSGRRLEEDKSKGVRTIKVDWKDRKRISQELIRRGFTLRTVDALALATKNVECGVIAELCWSDDPDYVTGYVASRETGYVRITPLKGKGDPLGGRVYFIEEKRREEIVKCLRERAFLINTLYP